MVMKTRLCLTINHDCFMPPSLRSSRARALETVEVHGCFISWRVVGMEKDLMRTKC
jgi:hypothetical protein